VLHAIFAVRVLRVVSYLPSVNGYRCPQSHIPAQISHYQLELAADGYIGMRGEETDSADVVMLMKGIQELIFSENLSEDDKIHLLRELVSIVEEDRRGRGA